MRCIQKLPAGYRETERVNLQTDRKAALTVNGFALLLLLPLLAIGCAAVSIRSALPAALGLGPYCLRLGAALLGIAGYMVLHELTHAAVMRFYGAGKLRFGFTGGYAYAGSEGDYFDKYAYRLIALAPLVVWTLLLTVPLLLADKSWFWAVYLVQITNISGSAGDLYVTLRFRSLPETAWIRDTGLEMAVYLPEKS